MVRSAIPGRCGPRLRCGILAALVSLPLLVDFARRSPAPRIALAVVAESVGVLLGGGQAAHAQTAPSAPTGLKAFPGSSVGQVTLLWDNPNNNTITRYEWRHRKPSHSSEWGEWVTIQHSNANTTYFRPGNLNVGTVYDIQVRAVAGNTVTVNGVSSASVSVTPPSTATTVVPTPTGLKAFAGPGAREVTLLWDNPKNGNITGYQYWMTPDRVWLSVSGSNAATTSFTVPSLTAGTTYGFQVRAVVGSLTGRETPWVGATPSANANKAPKVAIPIPDQTATADAAFSYTFPADTFTDEENDTLTYKFTQAVSANQPAWLRFNATTRTFSGTPNSLFATGFVWTITVTASDPFNSVSDSFSIRVRPAALTGLTAAAAPRRAEVTLTWDNPRIGNITGYQYRVRDSTKPSAQAVSAWASISVSRTVNTVSHTVTGLTANTHYSFQVRAVAGTVNSLETPWVNARTAASNGAPTVEKTIPDQTATAGAAFSYTFPADTFKDTDSTLTYKATKQNGTALPAWLSFNATTRTFSGTPNGNNAGTLTVKVTAIDDGPGDVSDSFRIRVNNVTSLAAPTGLTAATGPGAGEATLRWDNPKNSAISGYEYRQKAGTASYGTWTDISNSDKDTVEYTVTGLTAVYYSFRVRAVAGSLGGESTATVGLTVSSSVNAAPTVEKTIPDQTATAGAAFSYTFPADTFKDTDSTLTYKATKQNGTALPAWLSFNATTRTFSGTPGENDVDVLTVKVTATDGASDVSDSFYISVRPSAPTGLTATPGPGAGEVTLRWNRPKNSAIKGYQFRNRVDGITYRWRRLVVADVDSTSARVIPVPAAIYGRAYGFQIRLEAGRGRGWVVSESTAWVVATVSSSVNAAPTVEKTIPDQTATAGAAFSYTFPADTFKDTDSTLAYKATKQNGTALPAWLSFNATTRTFSGTPGGNDVGSLTVKVTATDGASDVSDSFDIVVSNVAALAAPTGLKVLAGPGAREVTLTWDDPGNKAVTRYQYRQKGSSRRYGAWTDISNSDKDTVRHTVTGLSRTISILQIVYTFQVRAVAGSLKGAASAAVTGSTEEKPSAPTGLTATAGPRGRQVTLQWTRPSPSANIRYQYRQKAGTASYGAWTDISNSDKNTVKHTVTGLTNGTAYTFQVRAVVGLVIGTASGAVTGTPFAEPPAPTGFKAATGPGAGEVTLRWDNPKNSAVSGYEYRQKAGTAPYGAWTDISNSDSDTVEYTVTGLTNGTAYTFQVRARIGTVSSAPSNNAVATPSSSGNAAPTVANAIPDQITTAGAAFSYTFPADTFKDTDSTLIYRATKQNGTALPAWLSFNATTRTFSGTPDGNDVGRLTVKVTATDGANDVSDSFGIIVITNAASLAAPTGLTATPGPGVGEITLKWAKPNNPESAVIGYQYRQKAGADPYGAWTDISNSDKDTVKHTVTGLTNGTTYTFQVRAKLKLTKGIASGDITATPLPPPAAPTGLAAAVQSARSSRDRSITLRWDDPRNPAITKWEYRLTYNWRGSRQIKPWTTISRAATTTSHTINSRVLSLSHSHGTYTIQVRARIGTTSGPWSVVRARLANWRTPVSGQAPTRTKPIPDQRAMAGAAFSYTFPADTFTDPDSSTLTYRATQQDDTALPAWLSFDAGKRTFSGTPGENDVGRLTVKVAASDSYNEASDSFVISIDDDASLAAGSITESGAVLTLSNGPGVWYYKETAPSGGSCSTAVSGASATLTGLSAATGYTYRAYGDSGCSEEVGRVSFSTGAVQPGVLLSADSLSLTELGGAAGEKRYRIRLSTDPGQDVTVTVKPVIGAGGVGAVTVEPAVGVSFTGGSGGNWGTEQAVRVSALNDGDVTGESFQISHSVTAPAGNEYENVTVGNVAVTVADAGHGVTASVDSLTVRENNGTASYGLRLESAPGGPVTVTPTVSDDSHVTVGGAVSFSDSDWSTAKSVTVTGVGAASDRASISHVVSVGTSAYPTTLSGLPVVAVTVTADSRPVVSIAGESATVTEGSGAGFRVSAVPAPAAPLVVNLTVGETGEGDFVLAGNEGSRTVTVPVTGSAVFTVNTETDSTDEPNGEVRVTVAGDGAYRGAPAATVTVMDDDATPVVLSRTGTGAIAEDGGAATLTVRLGRRLYGGERVTAPLVVSGVGISADDYTLTLAGGQGQNTGVSLSTSAPHSGAEPAVVFTGHDANTVQTATLWLAAIDDNANEGTGESLTVAFGSGNRAVVSTLDRVSGTGSDGVTASGTVTVSITDDDASLAAGSITESGAVLTLSNGPGVWYYKETAPSGGSCSTAVSGASATLTGLSAATGYTYRAYGDSGCSEEVGRVSFSTGAVQPGVLLSADSLSLTELGGAAGEKRYRIRLSTDPGQDVTVTVKPVIGAGGVGAVTVEPAVGVSFTGGSGGNWGTEQAVRVSALNDGDVTGESFQISHSVTAPAGNEYENVTVGNVAVTVADAGHGVTASVDSLTVRENNGTASYGLRLESAPGGPVTVTPTVSDDSHVTVGGAVSFSDSDWSTAKSVTVTGVGAASDRASISHVVSVGTSAYPTTLSGLPVVAVTVTADSRPVVSIAGESATVTEGSGAGFRVSAVPAPAAPLVVNLTVGETGEGDFVLAGNEGSRTVTVPVTGSAVFTVNTETDSTDEPNGEVRVTVAGDGAYRGAPAATVTVMDDDATPVVLSRTGTGAIAEDGGAATLTVRLGRRLYGGERVTAPLVVSGVGISADDYTLTLAGGQGQNTGVSLSTSAPHSGAEPAVVFTGHDANTVQTATLWLAAIDDNANEGTGESLTVAFGSGNRAVVSTLDRVSGTGSDGVTASGTVTVSITDDDASLAAGSITESGAVLTLSNGPGVWYYKETAPSGGSCSTAVSGASATLTGLSAATGYTYRAYGDSGCSEEVGRVSFSTGAVQPGVLLSADSLSLTELGGAAGEKRYRIRLSTDPGQDVTVTVKPVIGAGGVGAVTVEPAVGVSFTGGSGGNWGTEQAVRVSALNDGDVTGESFQISHSVTAPAGNEYENVTVGNVAVTVADAGHGVTASVDSLTVRENNGTASYGLRLESAPGGPVTVTPTVSDDSHVTVGGAVSFSDSDWSTAKSVTVTGVGAASDRASISHVVSVGTSAYPTTLSGLPVVAVTVTADSRPVVSIAGESATVTEGSGAGFRVSAVPAPAAPLVVNLTVGETGEGDFVLAGNEGSRTVTVPVTGSAVFTVNTETDSTDEPNGEVRVTVAGDGAYRGAPAATVTVMDDDATPVVLSRTGTGAIAEDGGAATLTVRLGRRLYGGERVTAPLVVSGVGISADDYTLTLAGGQGQNTGVSLSTSAPHSGAEPAVVFTGHDANTVQTATLWLAAIDDNANEGTGESLTVAFGSGNRAVVSTLDRVSGTGSDGVTASGTVTVSITDDDASLAAGSITESGAVLTLSNGPGVWYYKETAPSGGSCSTAVSGASATLTGLSAATGYTYRAYGDSGCSEEVGRVSFSTGAVQPGVLLSADSLSLTELGGAAGEKRYRIRLSTDPGQDVTVTVKPVIGAGGVGAVTVEPAVGVSFTGGSGGNWGTEQAVRVSALNDGDVTGESFQISHSVTAPAGNEYENVTVGNVAVTVADAGHGVTASVDSLTVRENNGTASYGLRLESAPGGPVTVTPTVSDDSHVTVGGAVSFSDSDWSTAKSVTVTGVGAASDRASISHVVSVGTSAYPTTLSGLPVVAVTVTADSRPVVSIAGESATVTEGSGAGFRVSAVPAPAAPLVVNLTVGETGEGDFVLAGNEGSRTVTVPVTGSAVFTVNTETDSTDEPNGEVRVTVAGDGAYRGAPAATVTVMDDDATPVVLSRTGTGAIAEDGGAATLTVRLGRRLYGGERVTAPLVVSGVGISADDYTLTLAGGQGQNTGVSLSTSAPHSGAEPAVVFTGHDANTVQTATLWLAAIDDNANEGTGESLTVAFGSGNRAVVSTLDRVSGTGSDGVTASGTVTVSITDDDASLAAGSITESGAVLTLSNGPGVWYYKETAPSGGSCSTAVSGASATLTGLSAATGYTYRAYGDSGCSEEVGRVSFSTAANDVPSRPMLSVSDASAEEGEALEFVISLSQPYDSGMLVIVRTRESTARHGQDFRLRPDGQNFAVVTLHAGETEKTVSVSTLDDNDIYDSETFELYIDKVYFADDVEIADGVGVGTITNSDHNDVPSRPMLSVSDASAEEGEALEFVIRLSQPHDGEVAVVMRTREVVANAARQGQDFYLNSDNAVLVNFRPGDMEKTVLVSTMNDGNNHDVKTFELYISHGYASSGCVGVDDDVGMGIIGVVGDMSSLPLLSVGDASGKEGEALEFVVNLSSPLEKWVTVIVRTRESSPVSARNGQDFLLRCPDTTSVCSSDVGNDVENYIVMNFRPGETEKTVSVSALDDAHDDDGETFEVYIDKVYFADVKIADGVGVGTIRNSDPIPAAWLGRFGRTVSQQVVDAVKGRFKAAPDVANGGLDLTVAGEHLSSVPLEENEGALRKLLGFESVSGEQLVADSSFNFSPGSVAAGTGGAGEDGAGQWAFWGQGAVASFSGREEELSLSGDVSTVLLGADWSTGRWQAGAALSHSWGSGGYEEEGDNADGSISTTLLGLFPYGRYALTSRLDIWATGGYGWGNLTLKLQGDGEEELNTDTNLVMGAVGLDGVVLDGGSDGLSLTTTADALVVETTSAETTGLKGSAATVSRLRLGLEATRPVPLANGAALLPSLEVGLRQDGGDAETGYGVEVGAGLVWNDPQRGIRGEVQGRTLLTHTEEEFRQQGLALSFAWDPSPSNRGPSLSMDHTMGAVASGGMDALLSPTAIQGLGPGGRGQQFEAQMAYGFPFHNDRLTMTPGMTLAFSPESRSYGLLWSLAPYSQQGQTEPWEITLEGKRQEYRSSSPTRHSLKLDFSLLF